MSEYAERQQQLLRLIELKSMELDQASLLLEAQANELTREQAQLARLESYCNEYQSDQVAPPSQPRLLAMRGAFLTQLREGVTQQQQVVQATQRRFDAVQIQWFKLRKVKELLEEKLTDLNSDRLAVSEKQRDAEIQEFFQYRQSR